MLTCLPKSCRKNPRKIMKTNFELARGHNPNISGVVSRPKCRLADDGFGRFTPRRAQSPIVTGDHLQRCGFPLIGKAFPQATPHFFLASHKKVE